MGGLRLNLGEGGIRTLGTLIAFCGFQDRRIQPLCHLSTLPEPLILQGLFEATGRSANVPPSGFTHRLWAAFP
jgi:hypothetical protein